MTWSLVSLQQAKQALHVETTDDDALLELLLSASSRAVVRYLKGRASEFLSIDSPPNSPPDDLATVPEDIAMSVIYLTGVLYRNPDNDVDGAFEGASFPAPVKALLHHYRDPALA